MASKEEENFVLPQSKTWVLRVSIHCGGCKKKVKKIVDNISGVYRTEIDSEMNKVTVTGNVDAETLIRKLNKAGKHAELWPIEQKANANSNANNPKARINEKENNAPKSVINISESGIKPEKSTTVTCTKAFEINKGAWKNPEANAERKGKKIAEGVGTMNHENITRPHVHQVPVYPQPVPVASYNSAYPYVASNSYYEPHYNAQYAHETNQHATFSGNQGNYGYLSDENPNGCAVM